MKRFLLILSVLSLFALAGTASAQRPGGACPLRVQGRETRVECQRPAVHAVLKPAVSSLKPIIKHHRGRRCCRRCAH